MELQLLRNVPNATPAELRERIVAFERELFRHPQVDIPVMQWFSHGTYVRQITIPAGVILTGKIHKHACMSIVLSGEMEVVTDQGPRRIVGPVVYESPAGVKRAGRAITECVWLTVHPYQGEPLGADAMAAIFTVDTFEQLEHYRNQLEHLA